MDEANDRRREGRLTYLWPVWFSEDFCQRMSQGLMVDISSAGMAFAYSLDEGDLQEGQSLSISLCIPRLDDEDPTSTVTITQTGHVRRIETLADGRGCAAIQFNTPLQPGSPEHAALEIMCGDSAHG